MVYQKRPEADWIGDRWVLAAGHFRVRMGHAEGDQAMSVDRVEWYVGYFEDGTLKRALDGAQSVFSRSNGEKLAKRLGSPYGLVHSQTLLSPENHQRWLEKAELDGRPRAWDSKWGE